MHHNDQYLRNQLIFEQRCIDGRTFEDIGLEHGICKQRVSQIVAKQQRMVYRDPPKWAMKELLPMYLDLVELAGDMV